MLGQHQALAAQKQRGALHDVLQLADIAGPGVTLEHIHHGQGKAHVLPPVGRGEFCNKMTGQGPDILGAQAQRRQRNGKDIQAVEQITAEIKKHAKQPVIMKLSPNVTDITEIARAAEAGGADALSMINTLTGMKIDINRRTFAIANKTGGVSGPAVHPIAVRMVYQTAQAVKIPIIGMGGVASAEDALELILAGASAVAVGTANFHDPMVTLKVIDGIKEYMERFHVGTVKELIGAVH